jgi:hypothetical protein
MVLNNERTDVDRPSLGPPALQASLRRDPSSASQPLRVGYLWESAMTVFDLTERSDMCDHPQIVQQSFRFAGLLATADPSALTAQVAEFWTMVPYELSAARLPRGNDPRSSCYAVVE